MSARFRTVAVAILAACLPIYAACSSSPSRPAERPSSAAATAQPAAVPGASVAVADSDEGSTDAAPAEAQPSPGEPAVDKQAIADAEKNAYERARPVFQKYCATCHSAAGKKATKKKLAHFDMDRYPFGGHHAGVIGATVREVLGVTGEEPTMPQNKPGVVKGAELDAIVEWSRAFDAAHPAGLHGKHDHEHHQ